MGDIINTELQKGRFLGPFAMKPLPIFRINPIGFIPKKTPNSFRLITNLSQPSGTSVNDGIPQEAAKVQYPTIQIAIDHILYSCKQGHFPQLPKVDVKSAFRLLPLVPSNFPLMSVKFNSLFYIDAFLPIGASSSCKIYQEFYDALTHIVSMHGNVPTIVSYLDDHLIISDSAHESRDHL